LVDNNNSNLNYNNNAYSSNLQIQQSNISDSQSISDSSLIEKIKLSKKYFYGSIHILNHLSKSIGLDDLLNNIFLNEAIKIKC
jgi:hypothetical protein